MFWVSRFNVSVCRASSLSILLVLIFSFSYGQMRQVYLDNLDEYNDVEEISFYGSNEGFVAFTKYIGYTVDSGKTFTRKYITINNVDYNNYSVNLTFGFGIKGVKAFNSDTVIVYGHYGFVPSILYSTNGGNSFKLVYHSQFSQLLSSITDMHFEPTKSTGYAIDADRILKTIDRGRSWTVIRVDQESKFEFIEVLNATSLVVFSENKVLKTSNSGVSWQTLPIPPSSIINYISFLNSMEGWLNCRNDGSIYYTSDGGTSWALKNDTNIAPTYLSKIKFINSNVGYALGGQYRVFKTTDSGRIWEPLPRTNNFTFLNFGHNDLAFSDNNFFWAGGDHGLLELTTNGGGIPLPVAYFQIDTFANGQVQLQNHSKNYYQYKWFKNDTLIGTSYNLTYTHYEYKVSDTIKLVVSSGSESDTSIKIQYFNVPAIPTLPSISYFTPTVGGPGTIVSIIGRKFTGSSTVSFGGVTATSFLVLNDTTIKAVVNGGASGVVAISTPYGPAFKSGFQFITYLSITSFSPISANVGEIITINGTKFNPSINSNIVRFGGVTAVVVSASTDQLMVKVPIGAQYAPITVTVNYSTATSGALFLPTFEYGGRISTDRFMLRVDSSNANNSFNTLSADFDGDGKIDIIGSTFETSLIAIHRNTSTPNRVSFETKQILGLGGLTYDSHLAECDLNGDGKLDLLVTRDYPYGPFCILKNISTPGSITFSPPKYFYDYFSGLIHLSIADFDGDSKPDVFGIEGARLVIYKNISTLDSFSFIRLGNLPMTMSNNAGCLATDFDGDGKPDIVYAENSDNYCCGRAVVFRNMGGPGTIAFDIGQSFTINETYVGSLCIGDMDKDGKTDIIVLRDPDITILRNTSSIGNISFAPKFTVSYDFQSPSIAIGDLSGDGKPELIISNITNNPNLKDIEFSILENTSVPGNIMFSPRIDFSRANGVDVQGINVCDIDGDNRSDIIGQSFSSTLVSNLSVWLNKTTDTSLQVCPNNSLIIASMVFGSTYQWQYDSGGGYENIVDGGNFSGVFSNTLHVNNVPISWHGYRFRCVIENKVSDTYRVEVGNTWINTQNSAWENPANWSCGIVPDSNTNVFINNGNVVVNSNVFCRSLVIKSGGNLTINAGFSLTIKH